jgi:hypothetical protein
VNFKPWNIVNLQELVNFLNRFVLKDAEKIYFTIL